MGEATEEDQEAGVGGSRAALPLIGPVPNFCNSHRAICGVNQQMKDLYLSPSNKYFVFFLKELLRMPISNI